MNQTPLNNQELEQFKIDLGYAIAHGTYLDDEARESEHTKLVSKVVALLASQEKALLEKIETALPKEHYNSNVPSDRLNPEEDGEVIGFEQALADVRTIIGGIK